MLHGSDLDVARTRQRWNIDGDNERRFETNGGQRLGALKHIERIVRQTGQQREIWWHRARNAGAFHFHGRKVMLPKGTKLGIRHAIANDSYEAAERDLIKTHMRSDLPVIELGGCLGLVSVFISDHLDIEVDHIIVEANPALIDACRKNATTERRRPQTDIIHNAIAYDAAHVQFHASSNAHSSRLGDADRPGNIRVPACTLSNVVGKLTSESDYTLVCDIEGAEFDMFAKDQTALQSCALALVEVHPDVFESQGRTLKQFLEHVRDAGFRQIDRVDNVYAFERSEAAV